MTENRVTDWLETFERYCIAHSTLLVETDRSDSTGDDIDGAIVDFHYSAGIEVLYTPARHLVQVAQKVRVADNLFDLKQVHPDLAKLLLRDLLSLVGLENGDVPALPSALIPVSN